MKIFYYTLLLLTITACHSSSHITRYEATPQRMSDSLRTYDHHIDSLIQPYRVRMEREMGEVIAVSDTILSRTQPESDLGNLLADILLQQAALYSHQPVDLAVINFGGIRLQQVAKGNITLGTAFELMPFDNRVVVLALHGDTVQQLLDMIASSGGSPIAGGRFIIRDKKATAVTIGSQPISPTHIYRVAISDYLANGGDHLEMLKAVPQLKTDKLLRDAFIEGFKDMTAHGQHLKSIRDGRIQRANTDTHTTK